MKITRALNLFLGALGLVTCFPVSARSATVEEALAAINKLPANERQKRLEEGAKKEGSVTVYSNTGLETIRAYQDGFAKKYPFVKIDSTRLQGAKGLDRILLEHRVGKLQADVVGVDFDYIEELLKAGVTTRYDTPEKKFYANAFWDKNGFWYASDYALLVIGYNTYLVKPAEAPKTYQDLLNPKWNIVFWIFFV
jgi:iron(III) transport system substrate-binding protein